MRASGRKLPLVDSAGSIMPKAPMPDPKQRATTGTKPRARLARGAVAIIFLAASFAGFAQTYITPSTPGWAFAEETPIASGGFVNGPGTPPSGSTGSYQLTVQQPGGGLFSTQQYAGTPLTQLAGLKYNTYIVSSALPVAATMQFDFDDDLTVSPTAYQGRAVFDPGLVGSPALVVGAWQTWDPMTQKGWWGSGIPGSRPLNKHCTQATPCTLAQIIGFFPKGGVLLDLFPGYFGFKLGNGGGPSQVSIDSFSIGTAGPAGPVTQYNFALAAPAAFTPVPALSNLNLMLLAVLSGLAGFVALRRRI
jgi:hypothetical protein